MWKPLWLPLVAAAVVCAPGHGAAQQGASSGYPSRTIQFGAPILTTLGLQGTVMSGFTACSDDGAAFVLMIDNLSTAEMAVHSLEPDGKNISYHALQLLGYRDITTARRFFASDRYVATLVDARRSPDLTGRSDTTVQSDAAFVSLVLIYDRDGEFKRAVPIPSDVDALAIGVFDSGDVLLVSMEATTKAARLTVLSESGESLHSFPLFDNDFNTTPDAAAKQPLVRTLPGGGLELVQVVRQNGNLVIVPAGTTQPMVEVSESGVVRTYDAHLPLGLALQSLLNTDGTTWYVKTYGSIRQNPQGSQSMPEGPLFGMNPFDGSIVVKLNPPVRGTPRVVCEHAGAFLGLTTQRETGRLEVENGSIPH
jgi:hypothetical protein